MTAPYEPKRITKCPHCKGSGVVVKKRREATR